jgi:hypothetical protein
MYRKKKRIEIWLAYKFLKHRPDALNLTKCTEQASVDLYSGSDRVEFQPGHRLSQMMSFSDFLRPSGKCRD